MVLRDADSSADIVDSLGHDAEVAGAESLISDLLRSERMGHEVPGMRGVYGHVTPAMRTVLTTLLRELWLSALAERASLSARSIVPVLDALLQARQEANSKIGSHLAPKSDTTTRGD